MSTVQIALVVIGAVMLALIAVTASTQAGREALAPLGLRAADALVRFFERWLSSQDATTRGVRRG